ncbi:MAG: pyridoxamine 5'-phosphate oxidase family protein [Ramlibacter sp.]|nr:pyridoxamine 5'-phosphate oxidase family protein [Ramlibacter sp.]MBX3657498.1 pyridoxamine 5'-phosphate oxidase family protein [Ramlibacter sp.]
MQNHHKTPFGRTVASVQELRGIIPPPSPLVLNKVIDHLDAHARRLVASSPYVVLATSDATGRCDSSPRGGEPGFIRVLDERHLFIPEVTGNRRNDSLMNLLENPGLGMLVMLPGYDETLRINGIGCVVSDAGLLAACAHDGKVPLAGIGIEVTECYLHCAKAALRGTLWNPLAWPDPADLPDPAEILRDHTGGAEGDGTVEYMAGLLQESYTQRMY